MKEIEDKKNRKSFFTTTKVDESIQVIVTQKKIVNSGDIEIIMYQYEENSLTKNYNLHIKKLILLFVALIIVGLSIYLLENQHFCKKIIEQKSEEKVTTNENGLEFSDNSIKF